MISPLRFPRLSFLAFKMSSFLAKSAKNVLINKICISEFHALHILCGRELKVPQRRGRWKHHLTSDFAFLETAARLSQPGVEFLNKNAQVEKQKKKNQCKNKGENRSFLQVTSSTCSTKVLRDSCGVFFECFKIEQPEERLFLQALILSATATKR